MSARPVLCIQVDEETQLRLLEERHVEVYFALIARIAAQFQLGNHPKLPHHPEIVIISAGMAFVTLPRSPPGQRADRICNRCP